LFLAPVALVGFFQLLRRNTPFALAIVTFNIAWIAVFLPYTFTSARYMLPAIVFGYTFIAFGFSSMFKYIHRRKEVMYTVRTYAFATFAINTFIALSFSVSTLQDWPQMATETDAAMIKQVRPALSEVHGDYVLVSALTRGFHDLDSSRVQFIDLLDQTRESRGSKTGAQVAENKIRDAIEQGKSVYYLSTHFEQGDDLEIKLYFARFNEAFNLTAVYVSDVTRVGRYLWILYRVEPRAHLNQDLPDDGS
jgi:hypothetical protein